MPANAEVITFGKLRALARKARSTGFWPIFVEGGINGLWRCEGNFGDFGEILVKNAMLTKTGQRGTFGEKRVKTCQRKVGPSWANKWAKWHFQQTKVTGPSNFNFHSTPTKLQQKNTQLQL